MLSYLEGINFLLVNIFYTSFLNIMLLLFYKYSKAPLNARSFDISRLFKIINEPLTLCIKEKITF